MQATTGARCGQRRRERARPSVLPHSPSECYSMAYLAVMFLWAGLPRDFVGFE